MDEAKKARLEAAGWTVGTPGQFLGLTPEEEKVMKIKLALRNALRSARSARSMTQTDVAMRLGTKKEAVARIESEKGAVTIDNLVKALLVVDVPLSEIGLLISGVDGVKGRKEKKTASK